MESINDNRPILVQFENGPLKEQYRSSLDFHYIRSTGTRSNKRMVVANCDDMLYSGTVIQKQQNIVKYYVGVVDKDSHCIENVQAVQLCTLKPKPKDDFKQDDTLKDKRSFREETDTLVEAFGSARQKRLVASRKKNTGVNETVSEKVGDVAKKILMESPQTPADNEDNKLEEIVPKMDKDAEIPSQIFDISDIISEDDYRFLLEHAKDIYSCDESTLLSWRDTKKYPEFVIYQLSRLSERKPSVRTEKGCYICYLNHLITFTKVTFKDIRKPNPCPSIPENLLPNILSKFTHADEQGRNRCFPKKSKDKLYCYILILALFIEDFDMDCNVLLRDLKLGVARVTQLLRAIGCSVKTTNMKRKPGDGPSERIIRAVLETARSKIKREEDGSNSADAVAATLTADQIQRDIDKVIVKKEEPEEFPLEPWK